MDKQYVVWELKKVKGNFKYIKLGSDDDLNNAIEIGLNSLNNWGIRLSSSPEPTIEKEDDLWVKMKRDFKIEENEKVVKYVHSNVNKHIEKILKYPINCYGKGEKTNLRFNTNGEDISKRQLEKLYGLLGTKDITVQGTKVFGNLSIFNIICKNIDLEKLYRNLKANDNKK